MTISERSIEVGGTRHAFLEAGAGWPVILLHGFPLNADMWRPQLESVPDGWRFIAPDLRGFGRSADPGKGMTMEDHAGDVLSLMDGLELEDAVIGGLSMGGYLAFAMYRLSPSRFTGMLLADTRPQPDSPQVREGRLGLLQVLAKDGPAGVADHLLVKQLGETTRRERPEVVRQARALIESASPAAIEAGIGALISRPDSTSDLAAITCATLVLVGDEDEVTPPVEAEAMQRAIGRSTLSIIRGAGHLSNLEQPDVFSRGLSDFLRGSL